MIIVFKQFAKLRFWAFSFAGPQIGMMISIIIKPELYIIGWLGPFALFLALQIGFIPSALTTLTVLLTDGKFSAPLTLVTAVIVGAVSTAGWLWMTLQYKALSPMAWFLTSVGAATAAVIWGFQRLRTQQLI